MNVSADVVDATECCNPGNSTPKQHTSPLAQDHVGLLTRPQFWFEQLVVNLYQDHLWGKHFRVRIQRVRRNCKTGKELGSVLQSVSHVYKDTRFQNTTFSLLDRVL